MSFSCIDSHQHFWRLDRGDYAWLSPDLGPLYRDYLPVDLKPQLDEAGINQTIVVQAAPTVEETQFLLKLAEQNDFIAGVVGWVDLEAEDASAIIHELAQNPYFLGVRPMIQDIKDKNWMLKSSLVTAINALVECELTFDALVRPEHLTNLLKFLGRYPDLKVVIDHAAKPKIANSENLAWTEHMRELARSTQAYCKLSGLVTEAGAYPKAQQIQPYYDFLLDCFEPARLMWGSDWPVLNLHSDYESWHDMCLGFLSPLEQSEQALILGGVANDFYQLAPRQQTDGKEHYVQSDYIPRHSQH